MPAGIIGDPTKARSHSIIDTPEQIATAFQAWLQNEAANTTIHSVTQSRVNNGQSIVLVIGYELP